MAVIIGNRDRDRARERDTESLASSSEISIDIETVRERCGESLQVAEGFPGVNPVQLLDIFCLVAKIPFNQKMENNSVVVASLRTILWYLIAHDDSKDLILTQTFLHAPTSMVSPTQIFQLLVELYLFYIFCLNILFIVLIYFDLFIFDSHVH